jgi:2-iminobutanoate/2-iminopropanoate deaminase
MPNVETSTPPNTPTPIGPYSHIAKVGQFITIGPIAGVDPATGQLAGNDVASQTRQIIRSSGVMLESVGSDLNHVIHITVFLKDMRVFEAMDSSGIAGLTEDSAPCSAMGVVLGL